MLFLPIKIFIRCLKNSVRYFVFYNLKKPGPIFIFCICNIVKIPTYNSIYNFASNLTTLQSFRVAEMTYFHMPMPSDKEVHIFD